MSSILKESKNPNTRFTDSQVIELRDLFNNGKTSVKEISENYNVSIKSVKYMLNKITYCYIE